MDVSPRAQSGALTVAMLCSSEFLLGYDKDGQKMIKQLSSSAIDQLLAKDDPEGWRTVVDVKNNRKYRLTDTDLEVSKQVAT